MDPVRIGVIGLGGIATRMHIPALQSMPGVSVQAGAETNPQQAERTQARFRIPRVYDSYVKLLAEEELDGVYVCLPNRLHAGAVRAALEQGLHVLCEKPMGLSADEAAALTRLAAERNRVLMPGYNLRYVPNYARARALIAGKRLGKLLQIHVTMARPGPYTGWDPKSDWYYDDENAGVLSDQGSHAIDLIRYVCAVEPADVAVVAGTTLPGMRVYDSVAATFRTDRDALGTLNLTWGACANVDLLMVHGTAGSVIAGWNYYEYQKPSGGGVAKMMTLLDNAATIVRRLLASLARRPGGYDPYLSLSQDFIGAVRDGTRPRVTAADAVRVLETLAPAFSSLPAMERRPA